LKTNTRNIVLLLLLLVGAAMFLIRLPLGDEKNEAVASQPVTSISVPEKTAIPSATPTLSYNQLWDVILEATPFAYTTPLPEPVESPIDGLYSKIDQSPPQWWRCYRCADYRPAGGIWRLKFDHGVMRVFYAVTGWRTVASFTVSGDRLYIFNDPFCSATGEYKWSLEGGELDLETVSDPCAFDLRGENLSKQTWSTCPADSDMPACLAEIPVPASSVELPQNITVNVYGGDSRFFETPPDVAVIANAKDRTPPDGIKISYDEDAVSYGVHRVLWWNGNWIEAATDQSFTAIGVQFYGEAQIGWARVLFDGVEVWRGDTAALSEKLGRHGGYIEITGFEPGFHTIRAESLDFDYRPVTVAGFGFSYGDGVQP
jgi:hypothetical protein